MAYIITNSDFKLEYEVKLSQDMNSRATVELDGYIDKYAKELVCHLLGVVNYNDLNGYLVDGVLPSPPASVVDPVPLKWRNLVEGCEYEKNGIKYIWRGLSNVLVPYVYYHYIDAKKSYLSGVGEAKAKAKNANSLNPTQSLVTTWNSFVNAYQCVPHPFVSLLTFVEDNREDYEGYCHHHFRYDNQLGF